MNYTIEVSNQFLRQHLSKMLNEVEANVDNNVPLSPEHLQEYIDAAIFMSKNYVRKGDRVNDAEMLLSELIK